MIEENSVGDDLWEKTESAGDGSSCFHDGLSARVARCDRADTGAVLDGTAGGGGLKLEVQHAGNRVRAVLRSRTIPQHFDLPQRDGEDRDADKRPDQPSLLLTRASYAGDTPWRRNRCRAARPRAARLIAVSWCSGRLAGISCSSSRPSISVRPLSRASVVPRPRFRCAPPCLPRHHSPSVALRSEQASAHPVLDPYMYRLSGGSQRTPLRQPEHGATHLVRAASAPVNDSAGGRADGSAAAPRQFAIAPGVSPHVIPARCHVPVRYARMTSVLLGAAVPRRSESAHAAGIGTPVSASRRNPMICADHVRPRTAAGAPGGDTSRSRRFGPCE